MAGRWGSRWRWIWAGAPLESIAALTVAAKQRGMPLSVAAIADAQAAALYQQPMVLVRPDGHVAWRGANVADAGGIVDMVRSAAQRVI